MNYKEVKQTRVNSLKVTLKKEANWKTLAYNETHTGSKKFPSIHDRLINN